jgi:hypothetical protein
VALDACLAILRAATGVDIIQDFDPGLDRLNRHDNDRQFRPLAPLMRSSHRQD